MGSKPAWALNENICFSVCVSASLSLSFSSVRDRHTHRLGLYSSVGVKNCFVHSRCGFHPHINQAWYHMLVLPALGRVEIRNSRPSPLHKEIEAKPDFFSTID